MSYVYKDNEIIFDNQFIIIRCLIYECGVSIISCLKMVINW